MAIEWKDRPTSMMHIGDIWEPFPEEAIVIVKWGDGARQIGPARLLMCPILTKWDSDFTDNIIRAARLDRPKKGK